MGTACQKDHILTLLGWINIKNNLTIFFNLLFNLAARKRKIPCVTHLIFLLNDDTLEGCHFLPTLRSLSFGKTHHLSSNSSLYDDKTASTLPFLIQYRATEKQRCNKLWMFRLLLPAFLNSHKRYRSIDWLNNLTLKFHHHLPGKFRIIFQHFLRKKV